MLTKTFFQNKHNRFCLVSMIFPRSSSLLAQYTFDFFSARSVRSVHRNVDIAEFDVVLCLYRVLDVLVVVFCVVAFVCVKAVDAFEARFGF